MRLASLFALALVAALAGCRDATDPSPGVPQLTVGIAPAEVAVRDSLVATIVLRNVGRGPLRYPLYCGNLPVALAVTDEGQAIGSDDGVLVCSMPPGAPTAGVLVPGDSVVVTRRWRASRFTTAGWIPVAPGTYALRALWYGEGREVSDSEPVTLVVVAPDEP